MNRSFFVGLWIRCNGWRNEGKYFLRFEGPSLKLCEHFMLPRRWLGLSRGWLIWASGRRWFQLWWIGYDWLGRMVNKFGYGDERSLVGIMGTNRNQKGWWNVCGSERWNCNFIWRRVWGGIFMKLGISGNQDFIISEVITNICFRSGGVAKENTWRTLGLKFIELVWWKQRITKTAKYTQVIVV